MIQLDDLKAFVRNDRSSKMDMILPVITTLISGLIIILSISPQYLSELNPFTLLLLSIASALPIWAVNQLLWLHLERRMTRQIIGRIVLVFDFSAKEKKVVSFALSRLMKAVDIMRFIPSKDIANLVTIVTIYLGAVFVYFTDQSPARLYLSILSLSLIIWLVCLCVLHHYCKKIDVKPLKKAWEQFINNEELRAHINRNFARIEELVRARTGAGPHEKGPDEPPGDS
ncbi:MAG: hypothetical protein JRC99_08460 [Deltaproteobacteria bacterium]|nr:hypothetical protein [Deltaproteobacteria bacterium]RLB63486.1 MAG: hypothetical protein DRH08_10980 [Deltaproteobacteria bacterium]